MRFFFQEIRNCAEICLVHFAKFWVFSCDKCILAQCWISSPLVSVISSDLIVPILILLKYIIFIGFYCNKQRFKGPSVRIGGQTFAILEAWMGPLLGGYLVAQNSRFCLGFRSLDRIDPWTRSIPGPDRSRNRIDPWIGSIHPWIRSIPGSIPGLDRSGLDRSLNWDDPWIAP